MGNLEIYTAMQPNYPYEFNKSAKKLIKRLTPKIAVPKNQNFFVGPWKSITFFLKGQQCTITRIDRRSLEK